MFRVVKSQKVKPQIFEAEGQHYAIYRFAEGKVLTLEQTIRFAKGKGEILTYEEALAVSRNSDIDAAFRANLKPNDRTYVRNKPDVWGHTHVTTLFYHGHIEHMEVLAPVPNKLPGVLILKVDGTVGAIAKSAVRH